MNEFLLCTKGIFCEELVRVVKRIHLMAAVESKHIDSSPLCGEQEIQGLLSTCNSLNGAFTSAGFTEVLRCAFNMTCPADAPVVCFHQGCGLITCWCRLIYSSC